MDEAWYKYQELFTTPGETRTIELPSGVRDLHLTAERSTLWTVMISKSGESAIVILKCIPGKV
jgi:hypothetical protein